jgi:heme-degrading monooxygenase HmoA
MVLEIAFIEVQPENHLAFEAAVNKAVKEVLPFANGFISFQLHKGVEQANTYTFHINWETLDDHIIGFRQSDLFVKWRELIGEFFATPPIVEHWNPA